MIAEVRAGYGLNSSALPVVRFLVFISNAMVYDREVLMAVITRERQWGRDAENNVVDPPFNIMSATAPVAYGIGDWANGVRLRPSK